MSLWQAKMLLLSFESKYIQMLIYMFRKRRHQVIELNEGGLSNWSLWVEPSILLPSTINILLKIFDKLTRMAFCFCLVDSCLNDIFTEITGSKLLVSCLQETSFHLLLFNLFGRTVLLLYVYCTFDRYCSVAYFIVGDRHHHFDVQSVYTLIFERLVTRFHNVYSRLQR